MINACHVSAAPNWKNSTDNWGDKALVYATQRIFEKELGLVDWTNMDCRRPYTQKDIDLINQHEFLVVGGGGLILPDTATNTVSGWQWQISKDMLEKINIPIIVYAIGWNLFSGQKNNDKILKPNLKALAEKASFISLRHSEDVDIFNRYVGSKKAVLNVCPSVVMDSFRDCSSGVVGLNIAGDRPEIRYGNKTVVYQKLKYFVDWLYKNNYQPWIINHMPSDIDFAGFYKQSRDIRVYNMATMPVEAGIQLYRGVEYMFATRGHAQMVPMGLGVKTASLVSHKKITRFLDDVGAGETSIDISDPMLETKCIGMIETLDKKDFYSVRKGVEFHMAENMNKIRKALNNA